MGPSLKFDYKKVSQALNFFAIKNGSTIDKLKALKLVYLADRYHLRKYGRLITNDEYFAMSYGPVASGVKDIAEMSSFLSNEERKYALEYIKVIRKGRFKSKKRIFDEKVFSDSDIEALNFSWDTFGKMDTFTLSDMTHYYPEWKKHEQDLKLSSRIKIDFNDFFQDPPEEVNKCYSLSDDEKADRIEQLKEQENLEYLWA